MSGTQYDAADTAGKRLNTAITDYNNARSAPHTGSTSDTALRNATTERTNAKTAFDDAYTAYRQSMTGSSHAPKPKTYFVPKYDSL